MRIGGRPKLRILDPERKFVTRCMGFGHHFVTISSDRAKLLALHRLTAKNRPNGNCPRPNVGRDFQLLDASPWDFLQPDSLPNARYTRVPDALGIKTLFAGLTRIVFVPYALHDRQTYAEGTAATWRSRR